MAWEQLDLGILEEFANCPGRAVVRDQVAEAWRVRFAQRSDRLALRYHGRGQPVGERHPRHKLTWDVVRRIRREHGAGASGNSLALSLGVAPSLVSRIVRGLAWRADAEISSNGDLREARS